MMRTIHALLALTVAGAALTAQGAPAPAADRAAPAGVESRPADPISTLPVYEQRRYRLDLQDCDKQKARDRQVCRRVVHRHAVTKAHRYAETLKHH
jgi:hypothetical protein